jgi:DNA-binding response OmpR family regulator
MAKILIVEDDEGMSDILRQCLSRLNHTVEQVYDGNTASDYLRTYKYDLMVVDWNLPGLSGPELCKLCKRDHANTSVIMLTAKSAIRDKLDGYNAGADEYMTKPFEVEEFTARVRALLRRSGAVGMRKLSYKELTLEPESGKATRGERQFSLPPKELELLEVLIQSPGKYFSTEGLVERLWGPEGSRASLANCLKRLRASLNQSGEEDLIETVSGLGYRLK